MSTFGKYTLFSEANLPNDQFMILQNHAWIEIHSKCRTDQWISMQYSTKSSFLKFHYSHCYYPLISELKLSSCSIVWKKEYAQLSGKVIKIFLFPTMYLCKARLLSYNLSKITYYNRLNAEVNMKIHLSSIKAGWAFPGRGAVGVFWFLFWILNNVQESKGVLRSKVLGH